MIVWPGFPQLDNARVASREELEFEMANSIVDVTEAKKLQVGDIPWPNKTKLEAIIADRFDPAIGTVSPGDVEDLIECARWALRNVDPAGDFSDLIMQNPITRVMFRAGFLAAREMAAKIFEGDVDDSTPQEISEHIRGEWPASFNTPDPGAPRLLDFDEIAEENGAGGYRSKPIDASIEALPRAFQFLLLSDGEKK